MSEFVTGFQTEEGVKQYDYNYLGNRPESCSNAIKGSMDGAAIRVDDASPILHEVGCVVRGKNLWNNSKMVLPYVALVRTETGFSFTRGDLTGGVYAYYEIPVFAGETLTFSCTGNNYRPTLIIYKDRPYGLSLATEKGSITYTPTENFIAIFTVIINSGEGDCEFSNIQVEKGTVATSYAAYADPTAVTVTRCGKNLIPYPYLNQGASANGGTIKTQTNGGISFSGTPTDYVGLPIYNGPALAKSGTITFSVGGNARNVLGVLFMYDANGNTVATKSTAGEMVINLDDFPTVTDWNITFSRQVSGTVMSGVAYPQIEMGSVRTEYELFKGSETYTPTEDGTVEGMTSFSPTMAIMTDIKTMSAKVVYARDTDKAIKELERILSPARIVYINILASAWKGSASLYSQVVEVAGATKNSQVDLTPSIEQLVIFYNKNLTFVTENVDGVVTVYAIGQKPENDYTIQATVTEVNR